MLPRIISQELSVNVRDVAKVLVCQHFSCNVLVEFYYLLADILQEGIAQP